MIQDVVMMAATIMWALALLFGFFGEHANAVNCSIAGLMFALYVLVS